MLCAVSKTFKMPFLCTSNYNKRTIFVLLAVWLGFLPLATFSKTVKITRIDVIPKEICTDAVSLSDRAFHETALKS